MSSEKGKVLMNKKAQSLHRDMQAMDGYREQNIFWASHLENGFMRNNVSLAEMRKARGKKGTISFLFLRTFISFPKNILFSKSPKVFREYD